LIQLAVEEAIRAGIKEIAFVTSSTKPIIEAHFIPCLLWNRFLLKRGNQAAVDSIRHSL
jgi:UTP-glucose-1-phosphate uridylyltransferase